jgi:hypothetical protein
MSNEVHPPPVEKAREKIESALQTEIDLELYRKWRLLPSDTKRQIEYAVASALSVLDEEKKEQARRERRAKARKWYWKERKDLIEQVEGIARNSIVLTPPKITFRDFETWLCPHGWNWDYCESLGQSLISLREAPPDASSANRLRELRKAQIDPDTARLGEDVCAPGTRDRCRPPQRSAPPNGRPPQMVDRTLLETVIPCLKHAGWTYVRSCDFLAVLLIYGFGRNPESRATLPRNLNRQWRHLHPTFRTAPDTFMNKMLRKSARVAAAVAGAGHSD